MAIEYWLAFVAASTVLVALPGPTVLLVVSYALAHGRRSATATVSGVALGDLTAMTASMVGLGTLLATSATVFALLKWIGAAYLVYLGIRLWRTPVGDAEEPATVETGSARMFLHAYVVTALNPKGIIFFVAFLPQFLDPAAPALPQMAILGATFLLLATVNTAVYAAMASATRRTIRKPTVRRAVNRVGGSLLVGAGALSAAWRNASA